MANIKNDEELVTEFSLNIEKEASGFKLELIAGNSCWNVEANRVFDQTYYDGMKYAKNLQGHVGNARSYILQISATLKMADRLSAYGIAEGQTFKYQI